MKFKVLTCQAGIAAAMLAVAPASHADFLSDLFGSSAKEPAVLPLTTSQILQKEVYSIDGRKVSAWEVVPVSTKRAHAITWSRKKVPALYLEANSMPATWLPKRQSCLG